MSHGFKEKFHRYRTTDLSSFGYIRRRQTFTKKEKLNVLSSFSFSFFSGYFRREFSSGRLGTLAHGLLAVFMVEASGSVKCVLSVKFQGWSLVPFLGNYGIEVITNRSTEKFKLSGCWLVRLFMI